MKRTRTKTIQITHPLSANSLNAVPLTTSFEVDEDIAELVLLLNKKGFFTAACCSGHAEEGYQGWYIAFNYLPSWKNNLLKKITSGVSNLQIESTYKFYMAYQKNNERLHLTIEFDDEDMLNMGNWKKYLGTNDINILRGPEERLTFRSVIDSDFFNRYNVYGKTSYTEAEIEHFYHDYSLNKSHENQIIVSRLIRQLSEEVNKLQDEVELEIKCLN